MLNLVAPTLVLVRVTEETREVEFVRSRDPSPRGNHHLTIDRDRDTARDLTCEGAAEGESTQADLPAAEGIGAVREGPGRVVVAAAVLESRGVHKVGGPLLVVGVDVLNLGLAVVQLALLFTVALGPLIDAHFTTDRDRVPFETEVIVPCGGIDAELFGEVNELQQK